MTSTFRHIALVVTDLRKAEAYYQALFNMKLIGREAPQKGELWYTLPFDKGWDDARAAGIELGMVALQKGDIVFALFSGDASPGQVFAIGLNMSAEEIAGIRSRIPENSELWTNQQDFLEFRDPYQIMWQISVPGNGFQTAGEVAGRWLEL